MIGLSPSFGKKKVSVSKVQVWHYNTEFAKYFMTMFRLEEIEEIKKSDLNLIMNDNLGIIRNIRRGTFTDSTILAEYNT